MGKLRIPKFRNNSEFSILVWRCTERQSYTTQGQ